MSLIKSISGIRGTIGGKPGEGLTPVDIIGFVSAFGTMVRDSSGFKSQEKARVIVGRDARTSGPMVQALVVNTLLMMGLDVTDLGQASTPTVEMAVIGLKAHGGIILTASHNPGHWNALKLLNSNGEFLTKKDGEKLLEIAGKGDFSYAAHTELGSVEELDYLGEHIKAILDLPMVNAEEIRSKNFRVVVDAVNSVGGFAVPALLEALGVNDVIRLNCISDGNFAHNPEPLPENLTEISEVVHRHGADLGIVVDPDVDRLALVQEDGSLFGEEYTLVAVSDYVLSKKPGSTVSNLSSSRALRDLSEMYGCAYYPAAVGEVNVVELMKEKNAVIGGEGNGGVIYPELHYGRDALVGLALFLSHLAEKDMPVSELRKGYPEYHMAKEKIQVRSLETADIVIKNLEKGFAKYNPDLRDGIKIDFEDSWVHLRKSNTEPIIRIYTEAKSKAGAESLASDFIKEVKASM